MTVDEAVATQLAMTDGTWAALQREGVAEGTPLSLDFTFLDGQEQAAEDLKSALAHEVAEIHVTSRTVGIFKKRRVWSVQGTTTPIPVSLPTLREWVERMVRLGAQHDLAFDGWGTELPAS